MSPRLPLCVDLDGTLLKCDTLAESVVQLIKGNPLYLAALPLWLLKGKTHLKAQVASRTVLDMETLPWHREFLTFLRSEHESGRTLIMATATHRGIAERIAGHLGIFDHVIASDNEVNVKGKTKRRLLEQRFGRKGFVYAGSDRADIPVWTGAGAAVLVNAHRGMRCRALRHTVIEREFHDRTSVTSALLRSLRPYQWLKNTLLFVPVFTAHAWSDPAVLRAAFIAFAAFCLCASATYLINDLLDLSADRRHPDKRQRGLASGDLPMRWALSTIPLFLLSGIGFATMLPPLFMAILLLYIASTLLYSFCIKQQMFLDVLLLAGLYTLRIVAGTEATGVKYSAWLLAFSMFIFMSLALLKRYAELRLRMKENVQHALGRAYAPDDAPLLSQMGTASAYLSILVLALYLNSWEVIALYRRPALLWLVPPLLLYYVSRMWFFAHRSQMQDDPIIFTARDPVSYALIILVALITFAATL